MERIKENNKPKTTVITPTSDQAGFIVESIESVLDNVLLFCQQTHNIVRSARHTGAENYISGIIQKFKRKDISKIKVSIIIPFFNRIDWTVEAIKSAINQTHKNLEIIVINDASTDNIEPIKKLAGSDDRIKIMENKRKKGAAGARNTGIDVSGGEFIAFLDSDDLFVPEKIYLQLTEMVRGGYLFSHTSYFNFGGKKNKNVGFGGFDLTYPDSISTCLVATPTVMIHRDIFRNMKNRFPEEFNIGEDVCLWIKISKISRSIGINKFLTKVRLHGENAAIDNAKQVAGLDNILSYAIINFLNDESRFNIEKLDGSLIYFGGESKKILIRQYLFATDILHIGDTDLVGNKFNGHDLHLYIREMGIDSKQLVWDKESKDDSTFQIARDRQNREDIYRQVESLQSQYSLNELLNPLGYDILTDPLFLNAKAVHLHPIHNHIFDIQLLPLMSRLKPIVWTLHDPWALGGHCIHHSACEKWKEQCFDCPNLEMPFGLLKDNSTLNFTIKKNAIQNSNLEIVVTSNWMKEKVLQSPIFEGKKIHVIPFGINQEVFTPTDKSQARRKLGIPEKALVISFRCDYSGFKGMDFIENVLEKIQTKKKVVLLVLNDKLRKSYGNYKVKEYGWVKDDNLLARIYSASDLFLMPSIVESFGMMAIEAMSCGTLPIILDGTALPNIVNAPECGVSTVRNREDYLKAVQFYIINDQEREARAEKCAKFANSHYNKDDYVLKLINLYAEAKKKHQLTNEYEVLLDQLKKHMSVESALDYNNETSKKDSMGRKDQKIIEAAKLVVKKVLRKVLWYTSLSFRMHQENRHQLNLLLEKAKSVDRKNQGIIAEQNIILMERLQTLEKSISEIRRDHTARYRKKH